MFLFSAALWSTLVVSMLTVVYSQSDNPDTSSETGDKDALWCQKQIGDIKLFEVFPGLGWDNLRNKEASQVVKYTFNKCKITDDGGYLIPDNVFTVPLKMSRVDSFAQIIDSWFNTSSLTSRTINVNAGLSFGVSSISGKFSREMEQMKAKQIENKASTVRVLLRHHRYEVKLQPHSTLSAQFKTSVRSLASRLELNQTEMAFYEAQLIVRDFGTHVLTSVTAGAALVKDDYIKRAYIASQSNQKTKILASASASFAGIFKIDSSYSQSTEDSVDKSYSNSMTYSSITSLGGPLIFSSDMKIDQWAQAVDTNLVPMDRTGDPLYFVITPRRFPELPPAMVTEVAGYVRRAILIYYDMNVIPGCTVQGSREFSSFANFDDGSCTTTPSNTTFGGVYQTCTVSGRYLHTSPCSGMSHVNPKTGGHSCPQGYTGVNIYQGSKLGRQESRRTCRRCGFLHLRRCCNTNYYQARAYYKTYWCAALGPVHPHSGYRFGGVYTSTSVNLVTGNKGCPTNFKTQRLLADLTICLSDDFELSTPFSIPFAGFFSCQRGNPLVLENKDPEPSNWPSRCPEGFSQHLATNIMGCAVHYCAESGALSGPTLPPVKRPPFMLKPAMPMESAETFVMYDMKTQTWMMGQQARNQLNETKIEAKTDAIVDEQDQNNSGPKIQSAVLTLISMVCILLPALKHLNFDLTA
ncbi:hypothetical protein RRG08_018315 [Elysia crispata]|uniref:MACPF domain-containing protein n=1 Tax=Elysia crispata TaxID=231223 RepID=A0AAE1E6E0_9GAST|nr:hypothetical protein RRG08_018315 [Elysia crispata]